MKSLPYVIIISNESDQIQKAVLFGGEENKEKVNFGCDSGIKFIMGVSDVSYLEMLMQSVAKPFKVETTEIYSTSQQLALPICYTVKDITPPIGIIKKPIDLENINGCAKTSKIDLIAENTDIELNVLPKTIIVVKIYPSEKSNTRSTLSGQEGHRPNK